ncbi:hypothetical protein [Paraburkholderia sp. RCC_158]|uniref:hypothetical protein n=1 Tax=Paraburkholderia sp. RCC_158 TaxID=3239220 RepID=UPI003526AA85
MSDAQTERSGDATMLQRALGPANVPTALMRPQSTRRRRSLFYEAVIHGASFRGGAITAFYRSLHQGARLAGTPALAAYRSDADDTACEM